MLPDAESPDYIDIREAVYLRMASPEVCEEVKARGSVTEEIEGRIFERMFPAMREEAIFRHQAGDRHGYQVTDSCVHRRVDNIALCGLSVRKGVR